MWCCSVPFVPMASHGSVAQLVEVLRDGGVVVLPTDTVVGLAALPRDRAAMSRLHALKGRESTQPCAVLVADADQGLGLLHDPTPQVAAWMRELWPGGLTIVGRRAESASDLDLGGDPTTIGVRCPDDDRVRAVAAEVGPLAATSANRHGEPTSTDPAEAASSLHGAVDLVVDDRPAGTVASTVVDITTDPWTVLRAGAVSEDRLREVVA